MLLISINKYVHKRNNNNNIKSGKTSVIFLFAIYVSFLPKTEGELSVLI